MIVYGYAKGHRYNDDGSFHVQVRIPNIHGPYLQSEASGATIRNYVRDADLLYYPSLLLPRLPNEGDIVALSSTKDATDNQSFLVLGLTGASYHMNNGGK